MNVEFDFNKKVSMLIEQLQKVEGYYDILEEIIDLHIRIDKKDEIVNKLDIHIRESLCIDSATLIQYIVQPLLIDIHELSIDVNKYRKTYMFLNKIKLKYATLFREWLGYHKTPFMLQGIETNIANQQSIHDMKISRCDDETLNVQITSEVLIAITGNLAQVAKMSLEKGIYNLTVQNIQSYLANTRDLADLLENILLSSNNE